MNNKRVYVILVEYRGEKNGDKYFYEDIYICTDKEFSINKAYQIAKEEYKTNELYLYCKEYRYNESGTYFFEFNDFIGNNKNSISIQVNEKILNFNENICFRHYGTIYE
tara:strand:- start:245 stop:571 length:327 start_codon:yes stop_codon:yes gene_type:complete